MSNQYKQSHIPIEIWNHLLWVIALESLIKMAKNSNSRTEARSNLKPSPNILEYPILSYNNIKKIDQKSFNPPFLRKSEVWKYQIIYIKKLLQATALIFGILFSTHTEIVLILSNTENILILMSYSPCSIKTENFLYLENYKR